MFVINDFTLRIRKKSILYEWVLSVMHGSKSENKYCAEILLIMKH